MTFPHNIRKYLSKQNLTKWKVELPKNKRFSNIIVIPALDEFDYIQSLINSLEKNSVTLLESTLILFVINNKSSHSTEIKFNNKKTIECLRKKVTGTNLNLGIVDASSKGKELTEKEGGVGFARILGMDLALNHIHLWT